MGARREVPEVPLWHRVALTLAEAGALVGRSETYMRVEVDEGRLQATVHGDGWMLVWRQELERWASPDHGLMVPRYPEIDEGRLAVSA